MPIFDVHWLGEDGRMRRRRVDAAHAGLVSGLIGVAPERVLKALPARGFGAGLRRTDGAAGAALADPAPVRRGRGQGGRRPDLRLWSQELSLLLESGIPLAEALRTLQEKSDDPREQADLARLVSGLEQGLALSAALAREGGRFDALLVALVAASEHNGQLARVLREHAAYLHWSEDLRQRLRAALAYPAMLLLAGLAVTLFLLIYVMPRFAGVFDGLSAQIPWASRMLLAAGDWSGRHPVELLAGCGAGLLLAALLLQQPGTRRLVLALVWRQAWLGAQWRTLALARLYRCLGLLIGSGVPVPQALRLGQPLLPEPLQQAADLARRQVEEGIRLSTAMTDCGLATPVASRMIRVGESGGQVGAMLGRAAAFHDEQIARLADFIGRSLGPALMLVMGVVIGSIVVLMYLPIFTLMEQVP